MTKENLKKTIILGDVHGCIDELKENLNSLNFNKRTDRLIFAGDLVDRGPSSGAVVRFVRLGGHESVCGNHDDKHIRFFKHDMMSRNNSKYRNPINMSDDKKNTHSQLSDDDLDWMRQLPKKIYIEKYNLLVVHAGVMPYRDPLNQPLDTYMYCRYLNKSTHKMMSLGSDYKKPENSVLWADVYDGDVNIVYGHNVYDLDHPHITVNEKGYKTWGIDTGCVFGGHLTAMVIEDGKEPWFHQTKAFKTYYKK